MKKEKKYEEMIPLIEHFIEGYKQIIGGTREDVLDLMLVSTIERYIMQNGKEFRKKMKEILGSKWDDILEALHVNERRMEK